MKTDKRLFDTLRAWCSRPSVGCYAPPASFSADHVNRLFEELHYYSEGQLADLLTALGGGSCASKDDALKKLRAAIAKVFGGYVPTEPKFVVYDRERNATKAERKRAKSSLPEETEDAQFEDTAMSKVVIKSKSEVSKLKKATPIATKSLNTKRRGRPSAYKDEQKISLIVKENPKRKGTAGFKNFENYAKSKTVGDFLKKGGTLADVRWDAQHNFIKVT